MANEEDLSYYRDSKHGWWWYEKDPEKPKKEEKDEPAAFAKTKKLPSLKDYSMEELWNMHPDDFEPLLRGFLKKAVQAPTEENVKEYYTVRISREESPLPSQMWRPLSGRNTPSFQQQRTIP